MRTVKGDQEEMINAANQLHPNLQFILEKANEKGNVAFLDNNENADAGKIVICGFYQKRNQLIQGQFLILGIALCSIIKKTD